MTAVDELRRAATLMRERARAATPSPWLGDPTGTVVAAADLVDDGTPEKVLPSGGPMEVAECYRNETPDEHGRNAAHIASWHPAVALAVAAMLDAVAATFHPDQLVLGEDFWSDVQHAALAVARTYLNGAAQ